MTTTCPDQATVEHNTQGWYHMARKLQDFDFGPQSRLTNGDKASYPWDDWFDGDIWQIVMGEDFEGTPLMMERIIRSRAVSREAKVTLRHRAEDGGPGMGVIVFQRSDVEGPQARQRRLDAQAAKRQERAAKKAAVEPAKAKAVAKNTNGKAVTKAVTKKVAPTKQRKLAAV